MKWTTLSFKQLAAQKTLRMDAKYWLKRQASSCKRQAASNTNQATSLPQLDGKKNYEKKDNYTCTICGEFTAYDEWAKPNVSCINCGSEE